MGADTIWRFDDEKGCWAEDGITFIEQHVAACLGNKLKASNFQEILKIAKVATYCSRDDFTDDPGTIALQNGEYDFASRTLIEADPYHNHRNVLPIRYDPNAECPDFLKFVSEVCPEYVDAIQELFGYLLLKAYPIHKAFVMKGVGRNGKGTLLNVMQAMIGPENCASLSLFDIVSKTFVKAELYGKLANISPDLGADELKRTGTFKALSGWDTVTAEKKNRDPFQFKNYAKLIFSCNQLPTSPDNSDAFFSRFEIYDFTQTYVSNPEDITDENHHLMNVNLLDRLTTQDELSGVFNWALGGYFRLAEQGHFTGTKSSEAMKQRYLDMADPVGAFRTQMVEEDSEAEAPKDEVYRYYHEFCVTKGYVPLAYDAFFKQLKGLIYAQDTQKTVNKQRIRFLKGLRITVAAQPTQPTHPFICSQRNKYGGEIEEGVHPVQGVQLDSFSGPQGDRVKVLEFVGNREVDREAIIGKLGFLGSYLDKLLESMVRDKVVWEVRPGWFRRAA
jgi:putative DNA primase/helicase